MKRLLLVLFALGCAASLAAQTCPFDCQAWNPASGSCAGAPMNGCNGPFPPRPPMPPAPPGGYPTSMPCGYPPVYGPGGVPSPGTISPYPPLVPMMPCSPFMPPSMPIMMPMPMPIFMPMPIMTPASSGPFASPMSWPSPLPGAAASAPTWTLPVNGQCTYECQSLFGGSVCIGPQKNGCGSHICSYNCQMWNPAGGNCAGPESNACP